MNLFKNLSLKAKMLFGGVAPLIFVVILGVIIYTSVSSLLRSNKWVDHTHNVIQKAMKIEAAAVDMETGMRGFLLAGKDEFLEPYDGGGKRFDALVASLKETVNDNPAQVKLLDEIYNNIHDWKSNICEPNIALRKQVRATKNQNTASPDMNMDLIAATVGEAKGKKYFDKFRGQVKTFIEREEVLMEKRKQEAETTASRAKTFTVVGTTISVVIALLISFFLSLSVSRAISNVITSLTSGSQQVASASQQLSSSSQQMSEGASEQASSLEEVSSSLEEMSSMTKQNADNSKQANSMATEASNAAQQSKDAMGRMSDAIEKIKTSSDETAKIIKTIDEIAMQTNLLALNAAVEAARAGEAGRGFAVVAEEVRNLAQRSAEAAKNTAELIEGAQKNSENGVSSSEEVAKILEQIIESVQKVSNLIAEVSAASEEQAQGIDQVNNAVAQMDKLTQQNAANSEESASASEELSGQAQNLNAMVDELMNIVGGHGNTGNGSSANTQSFGNAMIPKRKGNGFHNNPHNTDARQQFDNRRTITRGNGRKNKTLIAAGGQEMNPKDVIPLDDDKDLREF